MKSVIHSIKLASTATLALSLVLLTSCIGGRRYTGETLYLSDVIGNKQSDGMADGSYWNGNGIDGSPSIRIKLAEQRAYFYKGGKLVGESSISSGRDGYQTPRGSFTISQMNADHRSNLYGQILTADGNIAVSDADIRKDTIPKGGKFVGASMPHFMRFNGSIGMHAGFVPNYPASHGCVRLPAHMASNFFRNVSHGTPVIVE